MFLKLLAEIVTVVIRNRDKRYRAKLFIRNLASWLYIKRKAKLAEKGFRCGKKVKINNNTYIHESASLNGVQVLGSGRFEIGKYTHTGDDILVITDNHNYNGEYIPYDTTNIIKDVIIGEACWLGARVTLLPGTVLGEGCIVQAGSVVHGKIPDLAIIGGNPAQIIKYRDKEHFYKLKSENKYL